MKPAQALAHCSASMEDAVGMRFPPRRFIGRILGPIVKKSIIYDEKPMRPNSPTSNNLLVTDERDLDLERQRLCELIDRFVAGGPDRCTRHPHSFLGRLTPVEWAAMMYQHLAHHLRQFGV
jgi:transposase InsO family protein